MPKLDKIVVKKKNTDTGLESAVSNIASALQSTMVPQDADIVNGRQVMVPQGGSAIAGVPNMASGVAQSRLNDFATGVVPTETPSPIIPEGVGLAQAMAVKSNPMRTAGNSLANLFQSTGYGLIDKPLPDTREPSTWDYMGNALGRFAANKIGVPGARTIAEQVKPEQDFKQYMQKKRFDVALEKTPTYAQQEEKKAAIAALSAGKYALKGDFTGELAKQDIKTLDDALSYLTYKGLDPNDPAIIKVLAKYPVIKGGKTVGKFAGFDTDGEILVE